MNTARDYLAWKLYAEQSAKEDAYPCTWATLCDDSKHIWLQEADANVTAWLAMELQHKKAREIDGNPRAFFYEGTI